LEKEFKLGSFSFIILVFAKGHKGKEYNDIKNSLFFACSVDKLRGILESKKLRKNP
jgi:hypothetical protein